MKKYNCIQTKYTFALATIFTEWNSMLSLNNTVMYCISDGSNVAVYVLCIPS